MIKPDKALLNKNLEVLKRLDERLWRQVKDVDPMLSYSLFESKSSDCTLKVGENLFHSSYDPKKEARRWAEHYLNDWDGISTPIIFGLGLGYHVMELLSLIDTTVIVIEPDPVVFNLALRFIDVSLLFKKAGVLVAPDDDSLRGILKGNLCIMPHNPTVNTHPDVFNKVVRMVELTERYRILVTGPIYGGSLPVARFCRSALESLGYDVEMVDAGTFNTAFNAIKDIVLDDGNVGKLKAMFVDFLSELIMAKVVDFKPDLIFSLAQSPVTDGLLRRLKDCGIPTAMWFVEDYKVMDYWRETAPLYDYFFTIQDGDFFGKLEDINVQNHYFLPLCADPKVHKPAVLSREEIDEFGSDISFVGAGYYNRRSFFKKFLDYDLKIWGNEWEGAAPLYKKIQREGERVSPEDSVKIFNASKININLHSSKQHEGVNPIGDFVNPRTFEIAACRGFQLVDFRSHLSRFFNEDEEIVTFRDDKDAKKKIDYFLCRPEERKEIAQMAYKRVVKEHTYEKRMEEMMGFLIERGFQGSSPLPGSYRVKDLLKEAGEGTELKNYLLRFANRRSIDLSDIIEEIGRGSGDITSTESIFIMMNEFLHRTG